MTKKERVVISIGAMIGGWLLCGFAMAATLGQPATAISIVAGLGFSVGGFVSLILALKTPAVKKNDSKLPQ